MKKIQCSMWTTLSASIISFVLISCGDGDMSDLLIDAMKGNPPAEDVIDDDGVPSGTPGNESMFGFYSVLGTNSATWKSFKETAESNIALHKGDRSYWDSYHADVTAIWIVDEKTIYWAYDYIGFYESRPTSDNESILLESEPYTVKYSKVVVGRWQEYTAYYYLVHYIFKSRNTDRWEGRYAMNGSKMTVNTDETVKMIDGTLHNVAGNTYTWDYSDGTITNENGVKYLKVN